MKKFYTSFWRWPPTKVVKPKLFWGSGFKKPLFLGLEWSLSFWDFTVTLLLLLMALLSFYKSSFHSQGPIPCPKNILEVLGAIPCAYLSQNPELHSLKMSAWERGTERNWYCLWLLARLGLSTLHWGSQTEGKGKEGLSPVLVASVNPFSVDAICTCKFSSLASTYQNRGWVYTLFYLPLEIGLMPCSRDAQRKSE